MLERQRRRGAVEPKDASGCWTVMAADNPRCLESFSHLKQPSPQAQEGVFAPPSLRLLEPWLVISVPPTRSLSFPGPSSRVRWYLSRDTANSDGGFVWQNREGRSHIAMATVGRCIAAVWGLNADIELRRGRLVILLSNRDPDEITDLFPLPSFPPACFFDEDFVLEVRERL